MRVLLMLLFVGLAGCASPKSVSIQVSGSEVPSKIKVLGEFSYKDYEDTKKAVNMVSSFIPGIVFTNSLKISWMDSKDFAGITLISGKKEILIDKEFKIKKSGNEEYFRLGAVYFHEMLHFERGMTEPEVNELIDKPLFLIYQNQYQKILNYNWK